MAESQAARLLDLERTTAKLEQRSDDHEGDIRAFAEDVGKHLVLDTRLNGLDERLKGLENRLDKFEQSVKDGARWRVTTLLTTLAFFVMLSGLVFTILQFSRP